ncbi:MAG TPA: GTP cyclohydrolase I [Jatrophihabitantaceae bacterium]|jgi:GTP cyclohydrolase I|nr:GTP cyclohydrolase I [Jatrophihabitantaceae bacterium]
MPDTAAVATLRVIDAPTIDRDAVEDAVRAMLIGLGQDIDDEHLRDTPRRVASAYAQMLSPEPFDMTTFANDEGYRELVLVTRIPFQSLCAHHMLPFQGVAHVGYVPADRLVGLSKLARVVQWFARGLQVQERLTELIANCLDINLAPAGIGVALEADHACVSLRGAHAVGAKTTTSALRGVLLDDPSQRAEFFAQIRRMP